MAKKTNRYSVYRISGEKIERILKSCPRCGPGVFMAQHSGRAHCGKCGYAEIAKA